MAPSRGMPRLYRADENGARTATSIVLAIGTGPPHIGVMIDETHPFMFNVDADPLRAGRYRWTVCEGIQIHLRSPQSYATQREAKEDADKAMSRFAAHWRERY